MASLIYNAAVRFAAVGALDFDTDTFKMTLHTSSYTPDKDAHDFFDDVTNEITGTGYTAGGTTVTVTVGTVDTANDRVVITIGSGSWSTSTLTARYGVVRKARGGAAGADELFIVNDFGSNIVSTGGTFTVNASTVTMQN